MLRAHFRLLSSQFKHTRTENLRKIAQWWRGKFFGNSEREISLNFFRPQSFRLRDFTSNATWCRCDIITRVINKLAARVTFLFYPIKSAVQKHKRRWQSEKVSLDFLVLLFIPSLVGCNVEREKGIKSYLLATCFHFSNERRRISLIDKTYFSLCNERGIELEWKKGMKCDGGKALNY